MSDEPLLRVEGLERRIKGRPIVRGLDMTVRVGEVVGLLGPNGAGKTTSFRAIAGLDRADGGRVLLGGEDLDGLALHHRVERGLGYLPQEPSVFLGLTALENVQLVLELAGRPSPPVEACEVLRTFGLESQRDQRAATLSGGERRRLELARAVCRRPKVLVCDEPLTGIDPKAASEIRNMIRGLAAEGMGVLLTDHNVADALTTCDRALLLVDGVVVEEGTGPELASSKSARALYFGDLWCRARDLVGGSNGAE